MDLAAYGWSSERQAEFVPDAADGLIPGRVVGEHRSHLEVATHLGDVLAELAGRLRNVAAQRSDLAGVGDFVALRMSAGDGPATVEKTLPRSSALIRKASGEERPQLLVANVDVVFIVTATDGDFNLPRIERFLELVAVSGAVPVVVLNKADVANDVGGMAKAIVELAPGVPVHPISARRRDGIAILEGYFKSNATIGLIGSSGVGKSTLTNELLGHDVQATQDVRSHDSRGRHTTTDRRLFLRPGGGAIIDTPGMRSIETWNAKKVDDGDFDDIVAIAQSCKFSNCRHETEPGCAVEAAVRRGELTPERVALFAAWTAGNSVSGNVPRKPKKAGGGLSRA